ncbi:Peptidase family M50 [compost metagenome]
MDLKQETRKKGSTWIQLGALAVFLLAKGKSLLALFKLGKFGGALVSMAASIGAYALLYPWGFAAGFVLLLFIHELGHVIAAKRKGLPVSAPVFIPFVGALINMRRHPRDAATEAYMAFGGPLWGTVGATAVFALAHILDHHLLYAIAYVGFFLNLINLLPIHPLDGGRIATAVTRWLWLIGLIGGLVAIIYLRSFLFFIIWALFAYDLYKKYIKKEKNEIDLEDKDSFLIPVQHLLDQGFPLPGPQHRRGLDWTTYSTLDGQQFVRLQWNSMELEGTIPLKQQGIVKQVYTTSIEQVPKEDGMYLRVQCQVDSVLYENDAYYEVPAVTRWKFGIGYVLLAAFLAGMMYLTHEYSNLT